jgi:hypothetical protein
MHTGVSHRGKVPTLLVEVLEPLEHLRHVDGRQRLGEVAELLAHARQRAWPHPSPQARLISLIAAEAPGRGAGEQDRPIAVGGVCVC